MDVCRGTNLCDVVMGNKQEPAKSLQFHHSARHCVINVQSELRKVLAFTLYLVLNRVRWLKKTKGQFVSVGFITNWNFEMFAAMGKLSYVYFIFVYIINVVPSL